VVIIGDGSYLMMNSEIVTAVAEELNLTIVVVDNHGYQSIHGLQRSCGTPHFGLELRYRDPQGRLDGPYIPVDYRAHAASMGAHAVYTRTESDFRKALSEAKTRKGVNVVVVETNPEKRVGGYAFGGWWDVPIAEVSQTESVREKREQYEQDRKNQTLFK
jgi:3D-(3,5/4)-trihydroxycyclohexane-1,2-dione acylhydrolase (decyclizing)